MKLNYSGIYLGGLDGIVIDITLYKEIAPKLNLEKDIFTKYLYSSSILYLDFDDSIGSVDEDLLVSIIFDVVSYYNRTNKIAIPERLSVEDIKSSIRSSLVERIKLVEDLWEYFASQYLNPFSEFTFGGFGSLILFVAYLVKVVLDVIKDNMDVIGLLYSIGGTDSLVLMYILLISGLYSVLPVVLAFAFVIYWLNVLYGFYFMPSLIFSWLAPYILIPLIIILFASQVIAILRLRREGISTVLSLEF